MTRSISTVVGVAGALVVCAVSEVIAQAGPVVAWGFNGSGEANPPPGNFLRVSAAPTISVGIREDGTLAAWGAALGSQLNVPSGQFIAVSASQGGVGLRTDGTLASWGSDVWGQVSQTPAGTFVAVASGNAHRLALRADGSLVTWGIPIGAVPPGPFIDFDAGANFSLGLRTDGTIVGWGENIGGSLSIPSGSFLAVACGERFGAAIASDGSLRSWGSMNTIMGNVPMPPPPAGTDFVELDAGWGNFAVARRADGRLVAWGESTFGGLNVPTGVYSAVAAGFGHGLAIIPSPAVLTMLGATLLPVLRRTRADSRSSPSSPPRAA